MLSLIAIFFVLFNPLLVSAVIIRGTTVGPNYKRIMGEAADPCPPEFPWAFDNGHKCCSTFSVTNRSQPLQYEDAPSKCTHDDWIHCANTKEYCVSFNKPHHCPQPSSVALDKGCCTAAVERFAESEDPPCLGSKIQENTPSSCCPSENFTFIPECADGRQRCLSSGPLPHELNPVQPGIVVEQTYGSYFASFALEDSRCDIIKTNYWVADPGDGYFIFDLGYHVVPRQLILRNSHNGNGNDRGVNEFIVSGSGARDPFNWVELVQDRLARVFNSPECSAQLVPFAITTNLNLRYFKFHVRSYYFWGSALQYIAIE